MDAASELIIMKQKIEENKRIKASIEGKIEQLYEQLKEKFKCDTIEQADEKILDLEETIADKQKQLDSGIEELKSLYNFS